MKTYKVVVAAPKLRYAEPIIVEAPNKAEAIKLALAKHEGAKVAWGTEPFEVHPVNWAPIKKED